MPADEIRNAVLSTLADGRVATLNLDKIDHLDASALQILLALEREQIANGRSLHLLNVSPKLVQWFEYAGAADRFSSIDRKSDE